MFERAALILTLSLSLPAFADRQEAPQRFDMPRQEMAAALNQLALIADWRIVFAPALVKNLKAPALEGRYTREEAAQKLLSGTGLVLRSLGRGTYAVEPAEKKSALEPSNQMRLAQAGAADAASTASGEAGANSDETRDQVTVQGERTKPAPFVDGNLDLPRTTSDAQPYYIFDAKTINASGAASVEDFLKQRLTMNTLVQANGEMATTVSTSLQGTSTPISTMGNTSTVNLRGLGYDKTLILVNGRRVAGVRTPAGNDYQPDLNGIPLGAVERIEVLPASASGIYGGSAIGGVVNVILKRDYVGGEVRASYDNSWNDDSPRRTLSASYGMGFEGGRTQLNLSASWSDSTPLLLQDRADIYRERVNEIIRRSPGFIYNSTSPWLGALTNIYPSSGIVTTLTLKNGTVLPTRNTFIPAGTAADTPPDVLRSGLMANADNWNLEFPPTTQFPTGLLRPFGQAPESKSVRAGLRRRMNSRLELFADIAFNENVSRSLYNPVTNINVPAPNNTLYPNMVNPFNQSVNLLIPDAAQRPLESVSQSRGATLGAQLQLPAGWTAMLDYAWSQSRYEYLYYAQDATAQLADIRAGVLNLFVDNLAHPLDFMKYAVPTAYHGDNELHDISLRGSGALPSLPWGQPHLTAGLEHRIGVTPARTLTTYYPLTPASSLRTNYFKREQVTDSVYLEATVPLVKTDAAPGIHALDLQVSGRGEWFKVDMGTSFEQIRYLANPVTTTYSGQTRNGLPTSTDTTYSSNNYTLGVKYQPVREVTLRASRATAFLPPTPAQLLKNLDPSANRTTPVLDPTKPAGQQNSLVYTLGGGNPDLVPQNSRSVNAGVIWAPESRALAGLRVNAEYYRIEQFDAIGTLTAQQIVNQEAVYPQRVQRESNGNLYLVDISSLNLYHRETEGMDFSLDYAWHTPRGAFRLNAVESVVLHLKNQVAQTAPEVDSAGFPSEGGAAKYKSNGTLGWESQHWNGSWTVRYVGSYKQFGAAGGPQASQSAGGIGTTAYTLPQGGDTIPSQTYHDLFVGYSFDDASQARAGGQSRSQALASGLSLQLGVRNLFDKTPPLDVYYPSSYFTSPYGDLRLRSYWLNLAKTF